MAIDHPPGTTELIVFGDQPWTNNSVRITDFRSTLPFLQIGTITIDAATYAIAATQNMGAMRNRRRMKNAVVGCEPRWDRLRQEVIRVMALTMKKSCTPVPANRYIWAARQGSRGKNQPVCAVRTPKAAHPLSA